VIVGATLEGAGDGLVNLYVSVRKTEQEAVVWALWDVLRIAEGEDCAACGEPGSFGSVDGAHLPPLCVACLQVAISEAAVLRAEWEACDECRGGQN
jgi:hypothetical protein